jgi:hypothetical protein
MSKRERTVGIAGGFLYNIECLLIRAVPFLAARVNHMLEHNLVAFIYTRTCAIQIIDGYTWERDVVAASGAGNNFVLSPSSFCHCSPCALKPHGLGKILKTAATMSIRIQSLNKDVPTSSDTIMSLTNLASDNKLDPLQKSGYS